MKEQRTCILCRKKQNQSDMLRIAKNKNGLVLIDEGKKNEGRGCYVCKNKECIEKAIKTKALNRAFKMVVGQEIYEKLKERGEDIGRE